MLAGATALESSFPASSGDSGSRGRRPGHGAPGIGLQVAGADGELTIPARNLVGPIEGDRVGGQGDDTEFREVVVTGPDDVAVAHDELDASGGRPALGGGEVDPVQAGMPAGVL